jgi:hypothetical protein
MATITFYNEQGQFTGELFGDAVVIELNKTLTENAWVDGSWYGKPYYALDGEAVLRPDCPAVIDGMVLTDLPVPCVLDINGTRYDADESEVELDLGAGSFVIKVIAFPYLDGVFNVEN